MVTMLASHYTCFSLLSFVQHIGEGVRETRDIYGMKTFLVMLEVCLRINPSTRPPASDGAVTQSGS